MRTEVMKPALSICAIVLGLFLIGAGAVPTGAATGDFVTRVDLAVEIKRIDDLATAYRSAQSEANNVDTKRVDAMLAAESQRIDALLAAAKADVALANARAELTANSLAERVDTSAKALAAQGEVAAKAAVSDREAQEKKFNERVAPLEQMRYEQAGRGSLSTPLLTLLSALGGGLLLSAAQKLRGKRT
jgi:hypothetical protein